MSFSKLEYSTNKKLSGLTHKYDASSILSIICQEIINYLKPKMYITNEAIYCKMSTAKAYYYVAIFEQIGSLRTEILELAEPE